ncbi:MAG: hypothetical protein IK041_01575 [Bacteroidales bacterium]|nr:hypothetical protein [Bacteroidales bacterium]
MKEKIINRIKQYIDFKGYSVAEFERIANLSNGYLSKQISRNSDIGETYYGKILEKCPDISIEWLVLGKGEMLRNNDIEEAKPVKNYHKIGCPYFNVDFQAGFDLFYNNQTSVPEYYIDFSPYNKEGAVWCNVSGRSMEPEISNGDMILLKEIISWQDYIDFDDIYGIVTSNGFRTIKRIKKGPSKDTFTLIPANPNYEQQEIRKEMISHIFKVLCAVKKF